MLESCISRRSLALCLAASLAIVARPTSAEETNQFTGDIWSPVDEKAVMEAAAQITVSNYPNCDEATVEAKMERLYHADGTGLTQDETFEKVLTEKGKRNNRTIEETFMLPYSRYEVTTLAVIKPNGDVIPVDVAANSKETIDESQMSANIYDPNMRILQVNIPKVDIGDVIHSIVRQNIMRSIMAGQFADENLLEGGEYIRHMSYEVHAPADRPLVKIAIRDEIPGTVRYTKTQEADGGTLHHWEINNVPRMYEEDNMPPYDMVLQRLLVSSTPDWRVISKWYWNLSKPHLDATSPELKKLVADLTTNATTDMDRIHAIFYHVSKNIRYMGLTPEKDRPGFEPHDVRLTYEKKYGVCRDKAALLVSMLNLAGLHAYPVLINAGAKRDQEVADPFFNHAIATVQLEPGKYVLMDPTDENTRELLPLNDCNRSYLVCRPEGEDLQTSAVDSPDKNMMVIKTTGTLTAGGTLTAKSELQFNGVNDDDYRNTFSHLKPDGLRRYFEARMKQAIPSGHLTSFELLPHNMLDTSVKLHANIEFSADGMTANGNGKSVVTTPWIGRGFGIVNYVLNGTGLDKRKYPLDTTLTCGLQEDVSLKLDGFSSAVSMPKCDSIENDCVDFHETFNATDKELDCARDLKLKTVEFSPEQYLALKSELKSLQYDARKAPLMSVPESTASDTAATVAQSNAKVDSDARILDSEKELTITSAHSAVLKAKYSKKIMTYAGKIREAEFKLPFNPSCEDAKLIHAVVVSKDGERKEISPGEINTMDAGWNASAKRYTGGKILVANLPGVEVGSSIEVEYEVTDTNKPFISGYESFQLADELDQKTFHLTAPADVAVQQYVSGQKDAIQAKAKNDEKGQDYQWNIGHATGLPAEGGTPPQWAFNNGVSYFVGDMKGYLKDLNDTMLDRSKQRDKVAELLPTITAGAKSKLEKAQAIRDYVAKTIRSAGPNFESLPLSELSAADVTLADGYGHGADRAILLHAMFSAAGFQPEFVLASGLPPIDGITNVSSAFPLPEWFSDALVKVNIDGSNYYFNDTDQYSKMGSAPADGKMGLDLASQQMELIKAADGCADKVETVYSLAESDSGTTRVTVSRRYFGDNYGSTHRYFAELPPEERRRYFQEAVSGVAQGARAVGDLVTQFDTYPGTETFTVDVDNYSVVDGKYFYFELPFTPALFGSGADQRTLPLFLNGHSQNTVRTEIDLPPGFRHVVMAPANATLQAPDGGGVARITSTDDSGKFVLTHEFETDPTIVPAKDYAELLKLEASLGRKSSRLFLLEKD